MTLSRRHFIHAAALTAGATALSGVVLPNTAAAAATDELQFAIVGDYGSALTAEREVADLIAGWNPSFVTTLGDNVYSGDGADPLTVLDYKVGRYYGDFIDTGDFFPALGNHDWGDPGTPLLTCDDSASGCSGEWNSYFQLPGNGRYYSVRRGPVEIFVLSDYYLEPDGNSATSTQAQWLKAAAAASTAPWKLVMHHFPAYISGAAGLATLRWPFASWGIDGVFAGHTHVYERLNQDGIPYFVNGLGGAPLGSSRSPISQSQFQYDADHGAQRVTATDTSLKIEFVNTTGAVVDSLLLTQSGQPEEAGPTTPVDTSPIATAINWPTPGVTFRSGRIKVAGWAQAPAQVSHIWVVLKALETGHFWNGSSFTATKRAFKVSADQANATGTGWSTIINNPPAGQYQVQAWTASVLGEVDPAGTSAIRFTVA